MMMFPAAVWWSMPYSFVATAQAKADLNGFTLQFLYLSLLFSLLLFCVGSMCVVLVDGGPAVVEGVEVRMVLFAAAAAATAVVVFRVLGVFCLPDNLRGAPLL